MRGAATIGAIVLALLVGITGWGQLTGGRAPVSSQPAASVPGGLSAAGGAVATDPATGLALPGGNGSVGGLVPGGLRPDGTPAGVGAPDAAPGAAGSPAGAAPGSTSGTTPTPASPGVAPVTGPVGPPDDGTVAPGAAAQIACWGDSLTYGSGSSDGVTYPAVLAGLTGDHIYNGGVPGERSAGIAARQGGLPPVAAVDGGAIPASGPVVVNFAPGLVIADEYYTLQGTIAGVHGTLKGTGDGRYSFTRSAAGARTAVPTGATFVTDVGLTYRTAGTIIWAGHDDVILGYPQEVLSNIAAMAAFVQSPGHVLVLSLLNGVGGERGTSYYADAVQTINPALAAAYGDNYLDIRSWLISDGLAAAGITPTAQDRTDIANDIPPSSLRDTNAAGHLNSVGYTVLADHIRDVIAARGWLG